MQRKGAGTGPRTEQGGPRLRVGFILANNFTLSAFSLFADTLRLAGDEGDLSRRVQCDWKVMSSRPRAIRASCGLEVMPDSGLLDPQPFDYIAVIGGVLHQGAAVDRDTEDYLRAAARAGVPLIGVCTGTFVLARAGLLKGRRCCVSWYHHSDMIRDFDDIEPVSDRLFLIDGDRITSSGGAGVADLAATLVDRHVGASAAHKSMGILLFESPRPETTSQPMPAFVPQAVPPTVRRAISLMEQNLEGPLTVAALAARIGLGDRQLTRLFMAALGQPPAAVYRRIRIRYGRWLLERSSRPVADIAAASGFADAAHFGKEFRRVFGTTPARFRASSAAERSATDLPADRRPY
ncbi:GlxA family transcriptional regulator [uncultured Alsobacter sp.]|uniref:GlxA family transcriptional regulator n=1 Tax=uncultured Alsobacter sp. TaxID=1748258 RepID=UPI0025E4FE22|nr:GlxA family transcriptional regulator [uncultured Alsobacter sp.]